VWDGTKVFEQMLWHKLQLTLSANSSSKFQGQYSSLKVASDKLKSPNIAKSNKTEFIRQKCFGSLKPIQKVIKTSPFTRDI
jgi:hypothetical protein